MALNKKTSGGSDDRKAALAALKESSKELSNAAKKDAPTGYTTTADVMKAFALNKVGKTASTQAKLTRIGTFMTKADPKTKRKSALSVAFNFVCVGSTGKGQTPSIIVTIEDRKLNDGSIRGKDKAIDDIIFTMQRCGINTKGIKTPEDLLDAIDTFNALDRAEKPVVSITLSVYQGGKGLGLNVRVNKLLEDFEEEEGEEEDGDDDEDGVGDEDDEEGSDETESDDEADEEPPFKKSGKSRSTKSSKSSKSKPADDDEEEDDEEAEEDDTEESDDEEEESEDEESVEYDEEDPSTWVGYECKAKPNGYTKTTKFEIVEYLAKGKKLKIKDPKGKVVTVAVAVVEVV
jgi:hypothetical protein